jgi:hypothetical protein
MLDFLSWATRFSSSVAFAGFPTRRGMDTIVMLVGPWAIP